MTGRYLFVVAAALACGPAAAQNSFDCSKATSTVQKRICNDSDLAAKDRRVAELWSKGLASWPAEKMASLNEAQRRWAAKRDVCGQAEKQKSCIDDSYGRRIAELQIQTGEVSANRIVDFTCDSAQEPTLSAAFYPTQPAAAMIWWGKYDGIVVAIPSSSGVRYVADGGVELWEKRSEARVTIQGQALVCKAPR